MTLCGREGNHRSDIALAVHYRLQFVSDIAIFVLKRDVKLITN